MAVNNVTGLLKRERAPVLHYRCGRRGPNPWALLPLLPLASTAPSSFDAIAVAASVDEAATKVAANPPPIARVSTRSRRPSMSFNLGSRLPPPTIARRGLSEASVRYAMAVMSPCTPAFIVEGSRERRGGTESEGVGFVVRREGRQGHVHIREVVCQSVLCEGGVLVWFNKGCVANRLFTWHRRGCCRIMPIVRKPPNQPNKRQRYDWPISLDSMPALLPGSGGRNIFYRSNSRQNANKTRSKRFLHHRPWSSYLNQQR